MVVFNFKDVVSTTVVREGGDIQRIKVIYKSNLGEAHLEAETSQVKEEEAKKDLYTLLMESNGTVTIPIVIKKKGRGPLFAPLEQFERENIQLSRTYILKKYKNKIFVDRGNRYDIYLYDIDSGALTKQDTVSADMVNKSKLRRFDIKRLPLSDIEVDIIERGIYNESNEARESRIGRAMFDRIHSLKYRILDTDGNVVREDDISEIRYGFIPNEEFDLLFDAKEVKWHARELLTEETKKRIDGDTIIVASVPPLLFGVGRGGGFVVLDLVGRICLPFAKSDRSILPHASYDSSLAIASVCTGNFSPNLKETRERLLNGLISSQANVNLGSAYGSGFWAAFIAGLLERKE